MAFFTAESIVEVSEIGMETRYKEFKPWDSLMMMNLIMELEEEYDASILDRLNSRYKNYCKKLSKQYLYRTPD